ncbi:hypothetical protein HDU86_000968 [Geranomyces michiganensis]|nr:hypothetical protein HDU86_000968 [Geranomyces michiganensis]
MFHANLLAAFDRKPVPATPLVHVEEFNPLTEDHYDELAIGEPEPTYEQVPATSVTWPESEWYPYQSGQMSYLPPSSYGVQLRPYGTASSAFTMFQQPPPSSYAIAPQCMNQPLAVNPSSDLQLLQVFNPWAASNPSATGFAFGDSPPVAFTSSSDDHTSSTCEGSCALSPYDNTLLGFGGLSDMVESPNRCESPTIGTQSSRRSPLMRKASPKPSPIPATRRKLATRKSARLVKSTKLSKPSKTKSSFSSTPSPKDPDRFIHVCPHCPDKRFTRRYNLLAHIRSSHSFEKPFKCDLCPHEFARKYDFDRHAVSCHWTVKPFECPNCKRRFARSDALKKHSRRKKCRMDVMSGEE